MSRNIVWQLCNVFTWSIAVPSESTFDFSGQDMSDYTVYWKFSNYTCTIFFSSVFIRAIYFVWHVIILVGFVFMSGVSRASVTLFTDAILWSFASFTVTVSVVTDMNLNGPTAFHNNSVTVDFGIRADSVICPGIPSTKTACPCLNCSFCWKVLSKLHL